MPNSQTSANEEVEILWDRETRYELSKPRPELHTKVGATFRRNWATIDSPALGKRLLVKRSATEEEAFNGTNAAGLPEYRMSRWRESLENEAAAIEFVRTKTTIPVPKIIASFEDRDCYYLIAEYIDNCITAEDVPTEHYPKIIEQLNGFVAQLRQHTSSTCRSFVGKPFLPYRMENFADYLTSAEYVESPDAYVLCHCDLAAHNIFVDPKTYKIVSIIDWEYASFLPAEVIEVWPRYGVLFPKIKEDPDDRPNVISKFLTIAEDRSSQKPTTVPPTSYIPRRPYIPLQGAWDKGILPPSVGQHADETNESQHRRKLRQLQVGYPPHWKANHVTPAALMTHIMLTSRSGLGQATNSMVEDLIADYNITRDFAKEVSSVASRSRKEGGDRRTRFEEALHSLELNALLPAIFRELSTSLNKSAAELRALRSHLLDRCEDAELWNERRSVGTRDILDETLRNMERRKWHGYLRASSALGQAATIALNCLYHLPTDDSYKTSLLLPALEHWEARAEDLLEGGDGAITITWNDAFDGTTAQLDDRKKPTTRTEAQVQYRIRDPVRDPPRKYCESNFNLNALNQSELDAQFTWPPSVTTDRPHTAMTDADVYSSARAMEPDASPSASPKTEPQYKIGTRDGSTLPGPSSHQRLHGDLVPVPDPPLPPALQPPVTPLRFNDLQRHTLKKRQSSNRSSRRGSPPKAQGGKAVRTGPNTTDTAVITPKGFETTKKNGLKGLPTKARGLFMRSKR